ncbi:hypothetical protein TrCOL_g3999 [Triparma columacea]|uniref:SGF29 C-terminal domain-containing protein n=1 Tax=Triparma columacea TaxID=722753 RepID=A0A9W7GR84_9STRA|nr:hypothetical protein TrCOL_g3999 [Triparma columacea]
MPDAPDTESAPTTTTTTAPAAPDPPIPKIALDFKTISPQSLVDYIEFHSVDVSANSTIADMSKAAAKHFENMEVDEETVLGGFLTRCDGSKDYMESARVLSSNTPSLQAYRRKRQKAAALPGEQVAAKTSRSDENGSWILASVQAYHPETETYDVQDEDDITKLIRIPFTNVMRLGTGQEVFLKGSDCMAIFPETTSFYRAKVSKNPIWRPDRLGVPTCSELILRFMDDEDDSGKTPHRRVPSRYVIQLPNSYFESVLG